MILNDDWLKQDKKHEALGNVLTTKEIEHLYNLPINTVLQDIRRGKLDNKHVRKSGKIWLVTRQEANKQFGSYQRTRKRK